ncbi:MAG: hypothetical protein ACJ74Z_22080 [Bryobacteraceae bacterium]
MPTLTWHSHTGLLPHSKLDLLQGTLDVMVLQTLAAVGLRQGVRSLADDTGLLAPVIECHGARACDLARGGPQCANS